MSLPSQRPRHFGLQLPTRAGEIPSFYLSFAFCGLILLGFLIADEAYAHWFVLPVLLCGGLIGIDAVDWLRGRLPLFDPAGILAMFGLHFFFLAPLLHVTWDYWLLYIVPPTDWREWLGRMALINALGIAAYRWSMHRFSRGTSSAKPRTTWRIHERTFVPVLLFAMALSAVLQAAVYAYFGGIGGYISTFSDLLNSNETFQGLGWVFMFSEALPVLAIIGFAVYAHRSRHAGSWAVVAGVLLVFIIAKVFFGGLRGSRANYVWPLCWALGIVHLWVRPIPKRLALAGVGVLVVFMYAYGFYKSFGSDAFRALASSNMREQMVESSKRGLDATVLGDLGRADVQSYLLYRLTSPQSGSDYEYSWGRTYYGAVALLVPKRFWPDRPLGKGKEGTEAMFGKHSFSPRFYATYAYGLAGETMLNFGPWGVPVAYLLFGALVGAIRRRAATLDPRDSRTLFIPFLVGVCLHILVWDSDVTFYHVITTGLLPFVLVWLASARQVCAAGGIPLESLNGSASAGLALGGVGLIRRLPSFSLPHGSGPGRGRWS